MEQTNQNNRYEWTLQEALDLYVLPFNDLIFKAATIHRQHFDPNEVQISSLLSIKTGACPEDCKYCPQSAHYNTGLEKESLLDVANVVEKAQQAKDAGADRFCMGAAWRSVHDKDLPALQEMISKVKGLGLETCVTLGMATTPQLSALKEAGLDFYNHNIDTSESYYNNIITTRKFQDRIDTLHAISEAGLHSCSGGIIGMGESVEDRAGMLRTLANLPTQPKSVPINHLVPVQGTPLEASSAVDPLDFVRTIAVARIMLPQSYVRLSAGREAMTQELQALCFLAGANSIFYGETLLTTENPTPTQDLKMLDSLGMTIKNNQRAA